MITIPNKIYVIYPRKHLSKAIRHRQLRGTPGGDIMAKINIKEIKENGKKTMVKKTKGLVQKTEISITHTPFGDVCNVLSTVTVFGNGVNLSHQAGMHTKVDERIIGGERVYRLGLCGWSFGLDGVNPKFAPCTDGGTFTLWVDGLKEPPKMYSETSSYGWYSETHENFQDCLEGGADVVPEFFYTPGLGELHCWKKYKTWTDDDIIEKIIRPADEAVETNKEEIYRLLQKIARYTGSTTNKELRRWQYSLKDIVDINE